MKQKLDVIFHVRLMKAMDPWLKETDVKLLLITIWESSLLAVTCIVMYDVIGAGRLEKKNLCEHLWDPNNITKIMELTYKTSVRWDIVYV